ncbi:MAG: nicotinamidase [Candidatus Omnitrophica bacterium]|nr:nicotinamidase [Candidatus Omnitrophota bacterium]MCF7894362.1 nicotinamidase [Candidatus Omnitrophota bacterium]
MDKALLIIDLQNDFCPGGKLPVPEGDKIVEPLNNYIQIFQAKDLPIFASRDWHPEKTKHFKQFGGRWPKHCIQNTKGAEFHPELNLPESAVVLSAGMDPESEGYSVFEGRSQNQKRFQGLLEEQNIQELYIGGLATEFCVKHTVLEALERGFKVWLLVDAVLGIDSEEAKKAKEEMTAKGAKTITLKRLSKVKK